MCVSESEAKNLAEVESRTQKRAAGATLKPSSTEVKGKIVDFTWWMKKQGYADESTIPQYANTLALLARRGANIFDPESVKEVIAQQRWGASRKHTAADAYTLFLKMTGQTWEPPMCRPTRKLPFIPAEQEIDQLIAGCGRKTGTFLQLLKETAMRSGEAGRLEWVDIDLANRTITLNKPEKNSLPRIFKVSSKLIDVLSALPKTGRRVFGDGASRGERSTFYRSRRRVAGRLQNPRLLRISFHTLRHWKATMLYHQTKDILYVKQFLGHKKIENTLLYIQLEEAIFKPEGDEFTVRVAEAPQEIKSLLEAGFEYVCEKDGALFFRRRK